MFQVDIVTPDRVVLSEPAASLVAPGASGSFGVLTNHAPMLAELVPGELRFRPERGEDVVLALAGGFLQIFNNEVTVLADAAERPVDIDVERARLALDRARQEQGAAQVRFDDEARRYAEAAQRRAENRIRMASG